MDFHVIERNTSELVSTHLNTYGRNVRNGCMIDGSFYRGSKIVPLNREMLEKQIDQLNRELNSLNDWFGCGPNLTRMGIGSWIRELQDAARQHGWWL